MIEKNDDILELGDKVSRPWKEVIIDYPLGYPILLAKKEVGGLLVRALDLPEGLRCLEVHGIEVDLKHRRKGIASLVIKALLDQCDMLIGAITEDGPKPFWLKMEAEFRAIPLDAFGSTLKTVHTKEPVFFFITKNPKAKKYGEMMAEETPKLMRAHL
jgi:hypothetical protein